MRKNNTVDLVLDNTYLEEACLYSAYYELLGAEVGTC